MRSQRIVAALIGYAVSTTVSVLVVDGINRDRPSFVVGGAAVLLATLLGGWYYGSLTAARRAFDRRERRAERANQRIYERDGADAANAHWIAHRTGRISA